MSRIPESWLVIAAFGAIYFIWGSTYLFNYLAMQSIPPFFMLGGRFLVAGALLYAWGVWRKEPVPNWIEWRNSTIMGILFLTVGTGAVVWAMQWIDTGMAALIVAFDPLLIMLLLWMLFRQKISWLSVIGGVVSIIGMGLLIEQPQFVDSREARLGLLAITVALVSWAFATIYTSRVRQPASKARASAIQMIGGGGCLMLISVFSGEAATFEWAKVTLEASLSWWYLVLFGSLIAFSSFNFLLARVSPEKVATSTYVNPVVALVLGWAINDEVITSQSMMAGALLLTGVFFINRKG